MKRVWIVFVIILVTIGFMACEFLIETETNLETPTKLTTVVISDQSIYLNWRDKSGCEDGYEVERNIGDTFTIIGQVNADTTHYTDNGLEYGQIYTYRVRAFAGDKVSDYSRESAPVELIIQAPTNLTIMVDDSQSIKLSWDDNCAFETGFKVERGEGEGPFSEIADIEANSSFYVDRGLMTGTYYSYRLTAYTATRQSDYSKVYKIKFPPSGLVFVPGGTFTMGNVWRPDFRHEEYPTHSVTLDEFYIGKYEVTQIQFTEIMGYTKNWNGRYSQGDDYPVYNLSWYEAVEYCNKLSEQEGLPLCYTITGTDVVCDFNKKGYRLPTEAEWEYAARSGGRNDRLFSGTDDSDSLGNYAWYYENTGHLHPGGGKLPNDLGIYDMSGNVWEWCWDWYGSSYYSASPSSNPTGPSSGSGRAVRGGCTIDSQEQCRTVHRYSWDPDNDGEVFGFRICRNAN